MIRRSLLGGLCFIGTVRVLGAQGTVPGFYSEAKVSTRIESSRGARVPAPKEYRMRTWRVAGLLRMEGSPGQVDSTDGSYTIGQLLNKRTFQVSPRTRTVRAANVDEVQKYAAERGVNPNDRKRSYREIGDGGTLLGHRMVRWESRLSYEAPAYRGATTTQTHTFVTTYWIASDTTDPMVAAWIKMLGPVPDSARHMPRGMVLRSESRTEVPGLVSMITDAVQIWRQQPVDTALFVVPSDYRVVNLVDAMRERSESTAVRVRAGYAREAAMRRVIEELKQLRSSSAPADRARLRFLNDSLIKVLTPDSSRLDSLIRANGIVITDSLRAKKKP